MSDVEVYILEAFPFSRNGIKVEEAEASTTIFLPERLFDGLNAAGMVRRSIIGDGHITLHSEQSATQGIAAGQADFTRMSAGDGLMSVKADGTVTLSAPVIEVTNGRAQVVDPAPQPATATADLTEEELAALADGSWKEWRFFKQRSVAAKISSDAITNGDQAKAAIEAYIAPKEL